MRTIMVLCTMVVAASSASAQGARVQGDLYLVTVAGEVRQGAANEVALVSRSVDPAEWGALCARQAREVLAATAAGIDSVGSANVSSALRLQMMRELTAFTDELRSGHNSERVAWLKSSATATSATGMNAHYDISQVPEGAYWLVAEMKLAGAAGYWMVPIDLGPGDKAVVDLDNTNMLPEGEFPCDAFPEGGPRAP